MTANFIAAPAPVTIMQPGVPFVSVFTVFATDMLFATPIGVVTTTITPDAPAPTNTPNILLQPIVLSPPTTTFTTLLRTVTPSMEMSTVVVTP